MKSYFPLIAGRFKFMDDHGKIFPGYKHIIGLNEETSWHNPYTPGTEDI